MKRPHLISKNGYLHVAIYIHKYVDKKIIVDENGSPKWFRKTITTNQPDNKQGRSNASVVLKKYTAGEDPEDKQLKPILLTEFLKKYNILYATKNKGALNNYTYAVNSFTRINGNRYMQTYTVEEVDTYIAISLRRVKSITVSNHIKHLRTLFSRALKYNHVQRNIFEYSMPFQVSEPEYDSYEKKDFTKLIKAIDRYNDPRKELHKDIITEYIYQGFRLSELPRMKLANISDTFFHVTGAKTKDRYIEIHEVSKPIIQKARNKKQTYLFELFPDKPIHITYIQGFIKLYLDKAGLSKRLTAKAMRKTYGSWLLQAGVPIEWIADQMGNSPAIALKHYAKFRKQDYKGWINKMD